MKPINVLVVDDSALVRQLLTAIIDAQPDMQVVAACMDPLFARDKIRELQPDVITLDVEMPRMDGLTFLSKLMRLHPLPVVMISSLTQAGAEATLKALELGAVDYVPKPKSNLRQGLLEEYAEEVVAKIRVAAASRVRTRAVGTTFGLAEPRPLGFLTTETVIAIGASTGGTEAIKAVLEQLPADAPGTVITQHIPEAFAGSFAARMNLTSRMQVALACDGAPIIPGHAYIAPGDRHLSVARNGARYICRLSDGPPVNRHRPSVEVLFDSVAEQVGRNALAVMLTGMGRDGADAMGRVREAGGRTIAQDEATSVVWGMPGAAVQAGAAEQVLPLGQIAPQLLQWVAQHRKAS